MIWSAWGPPSSSSPHRREGAERRKALWSSSAPCGAARRVTGTRTPPALHRGDFGSATVLRRRTGGPYPHVIQAALASCLSSKRVPAIQGGPLIGGGRYPGLLGRGCEPRLQAPHPAPPNRRL